MELMELTDFHVGERLEYLIKKNYENVNAFANAIEEEKQNIYQDCKKRDLSTVRLKRYLPAFKMSFMEFFDLEGDYKPQQKITSQQEEKRIIEEMKEQYERLLTAKDVVIESKDQIISLLSRKN